MAIPNWVIGLILWVIGIPILAVSAAYYNKYKDSKEGSKEDKFKKLCMAGMAISIFLIIVYPLYLLGTGVGKQFGNLVSAIGKWGQVILMLLGGLGVLALAGLVLWFVILVQTAFKNSNTNAQYPIGDVDDESRFEIPDQELDPVTTLAPTHKPIEDFIIFKDNQNVVKYNYSSKEVGWEFDIESPITNYVLSKNDKYLLVGCEDNTAKLIDIVEVFEYVGILDFTLVGHSGSVRGLAITDNGSHVLTGSDDGLVKYWDIFNEKVVTTINLSDPVIDISFIDSNKKCLIATENNVYLYSLPQPQLYQAEAPVSEQTAPVEVSSSEPELILKYEEITNKFGSIKYMKTSSGIGLNNFAVATNTHVVVYNIGGSEVGSFEKTLQFSGDVVGFSLNPKSNQCALYYQDSKIEIVNLSNFTTFLKTSSTVLSSTGLPLDRIKNGISYNMDGSLITAGGGVWKVSDGLRVETTCPGCIKDCSCGSVLSDMPLFNRS